MESESQQVKSPQQPRLIYPLIVQDWSGRKRRGQVLLEKRYVDYNVASPVDEDFRIVILAEPIEVTVTPPERVAVCTPSRRLASISDPAAIYEAGQAQSLSRKQLEMLAKGRILSAYAPVDPKLVFIPGDGLHLDLLAASILEQADLKPYCSALSFALSAPASPDSDPLDQLRSRLLALIDDADKVLHSQQAGPWQEAEESLAHLRQLAESDSSVEFLRRASSIRPRLADWAEDVYLARALVEQTSLLFELLGMRRYLEKARIPFEAGDLALDSALLQQQASFALLTVEPHRFSGMQASFTSFRKRYEAAYKKHHDQYWPESLAIHSRLLDAGARVEAVRKLNTLTELGSPLGEAAVTAFVQLLETTSGCQLSGRLDEGLGDGPLCPSCLLTLEDKPPSGRADDVLGRLDRAIRNQLARLSATAVQQVLQRSGDPRVDQFLRVVQASQISSLADLLDDSLLGFLRRFLVEARIQVALQPILKRLETGPPPSEEEAEQVMRDATRVIQRAFRAARRSLPIPARENELRAP